jgi:hypothetical protein
MASAVDSLTTLTEQVAGKERPLGGLLSLNGLL